jgi:hypothetical protein
MSESALGASVTLTRQNSGTPAKETGGTPGGGPNAEGGGVNAPAGTSSAAATSPFCKVKDVSFAQSSAAAGAVAAQIQLAATIAHASTRFLKKTDTTISYHLSADRTDATSGLLYETLAAGRLCVPAARQDPLFLLFTAQRLEPPFDARAVLARRIVELYALHLAGDECFIREVRNESDNAPVVNLVAQLCVPDFPGRQKIARNHLDQGRKLIGRI